MKQFSVKKEAGLLFIVCTTLCLSLFFSMEKDSSASDLVFSNIEALAAGESGGGFCYGSGSLYCNGSYYKYKM